jgi:hypothetical protein
LTSEIDPFAGRPIESSIVTLAASQRTVVAAGLAVGLWGVLHANGRLEFLVAGAVLVASALGTDRRSLVEQGVRLVAYVARSRWTYVSFVARSSGWIATARGRTEVNIGRLEHRGRLDLSGADADVLRDLSALMDKIAASNGARHLSWRLCDTGDDTATVLSVPPSIELPGSWMPVTRRELAHWSDLGANRRDGWFFERWRYLRTTDVLVSVFALRATTVAAGVATLRDLIPFASGRDLSVQIKVESIRTARSVVGRHAHRWRANLSLASLAGFRRRASFDATTSVFDAREREVATGRSLGRVAVFIVVRGRSRAELEQRNRDLRRDAHSAGATLERGNGRHALWYCAQLPGSPPWSNS